MTRSINKWSDEADAKLQDCFAIVTGMVMPLKKCVFNVQAFLSVGSTLKTIRWVVIGPDC